MSYSWMSHVILVDKSHSTEEYVIAHSRNCLVILMNELCIAHGEKGHGLPCKQNVYVCICIYIHLQCMHAYTCIYVQYVYGYIYVCIYIRRSLLIIATPYQVKMSFEKEPDCYGYMNIYLCIYIHTYMYPYMSISQNIGLIYRALLQKRPTIESKDILTWYGVAMISRLLCIYTHTYMYPYMYGTYIHVYAYIYVTEHIYTYTYIYISFAG